MKKVLSKYYRNLRKDYADMTATEFIEFYSKYKKLSMQYRFLQVANFLERINIKVIEIPILRFLCKFVDFIRWKIYDLILLLINGRTFNLYRCNLLLW